MDGFPTRPAASSAGLRRFATPGGVQEPEAVTPEEATPCVLIGLPPDRSSSGKIGLAGGTGPVQATGGCRRRPIRKIIVPAANAAMATPPIK